MPYHSRRDTALSTSLGMSTQWSVQPWIQNVDDVPPGANAPVTPTPSLFMSVTIVIKTPVLSTTSIPRVIYHPHNQHN